MKKIDIKKLRERLGSPGKPISQADLAKRLGGVHQTTVCRLESGDIEPEGPLAVVLQQVSDASKKSRSSQTVSAA